MGDIIRSVQYIHNFEKNESFIKIQNKKISFITTQKKDINYMNITDKIYKYYKRILTNNHKITKTNSSILEM